MSTPHPVSVPKQIVLVTSIYLLCDALWLIGDTGSFVGEGYRPLIRALAEVVALLAFIASVVLLAAKISVSRVAVVATASLIAATAVVVPISAMWFPSQFPRDSSVGQYLLWISVELALLCGLAFIAAAVVAMLAKAFLHRS